MTKKSPRCVVLLTFDYDAESREALVCPNRPVKLSKGQFGPRVGLRRVLDLLDRYTIKSTFFVPGWTAETYPESVKEIVRRGHEVAAHGYMHENLSELKSPEEEVEVFRRSITILERVAGHRPLGYRAPHWEISPHTIGNLSRLGFKYDSSLMNDEKPYVITHDGRSTGLVELPVEWFLDDWPIFEIERRSPNEAFNVWSQEFEAVYAERVSYFLLTMHPQCIGRASRTKMLEDLIRAIRRKKGAVFSRCIDLAEEIGRSRA
jgi:peptidoglycan/xylan/chitin deacetylase (PgdA/CDA1 family)